jgi:methyl-accepting chemotaxis protein
MARNITFKIRIWFVILIISSVLIISGVVAVIGIKQIKIGGTTYKEIINGKDLIADILPPPAYIIESYLIVLELKNENNINTINQLIEKGKLLRNDFETRHKFWQKELLEGKMKQVFLEESYNSATAFYLVRDNDFIPAILSSNKQIMEQSFLQLCEIYKKHRKSIDEVVVLANDYALSNERNASQAVNFWIQVISTLIIVGIIIAIIANIILIRSVDKTIKAFNNEFDRIYKSVEKGTLKERADENLVSQEFKPIFVKMNAILDRFSFELDRINFYLREIGKGNMPPKIE